MNAMNTNPQRRSALPLSLGGVALFLMLCIGGVARTASVAPAPAPVSAPAPSATSPQTASAPNTDETDGPAVTPDSGPDSTPMGDAPSGYVPATDTTSTDSTPDSDDPIDEGYRERERTQDQASHAYDDHIRDTTTVQDPETGTIYTEVPTSDADPAIQSGDVTEVPTADLPTSEDTPAETTAETTPADSTPDVSTSDTSE